MKKTIIILLVLCYFISCKHKNTSHIKSEEKEDRENYSSELLKTHFSTYYIPYFLKSEVDSILKTRDRLENDVNYKNSFIQKAEKRRRRIQKLEYISDTTKKVPYLFKKYVLPSELLRFNKDSIPDVVALYELSQVRIAKTLQITAYNDYLKDDEIQHLIKTAFKDSVYYKELAEARYKKDSAASVNRLRKRKDSLQRIIHPIDSTGAFGPKPLGKMIKNGDKSLNFYGKEDDAIELEQKERRKTIYECWMYFLKLHPYADEDLVDGYVDKRLPPIKTFDVLNIGYAEGLRKPLQIDPEYARFQTRLTNIKGYEVYYMPTGTRGYGDCDVYSEKVDYCCFANEGVGCNSIGYLVFYDRKQYYAKILPAYVLQKGYDKGVKVQFFYIKENTIHVYEGGAIYDRFVDDKGNTKSDPNNNKDQISAKRDKSLGIVKTYEIELLDNGDFEIKKM